MCIRDRFSHINMKLLFLQWKFILIYGFLVFDAAFIALSSIFTTKEQSSVSDIGKLLGASERSISIFIFFSAAEDRCV